MSAQKMQRALKKLRREQVKVAPLTKNIHHRFRCDTCKKETPHRWNPAIGWECIRHEQR